MTRNQLHLTTIVLAASAAYLNSFTGPFQFDDFNVIVAPAAVHSFSAWWANLGHGFRPLLKLSYLSNWQSGWGLFGFHLLNLMIHGINSLLVFALSLAFGRQVAPTRAWEKVAFLAALLFTLHPVHSEAVTYLSGRSSALMATCYFAGLLTYAENGGPPRPWRRYLLSPLFFLLALAVKESAILFPFAILLWELCAATPAREIIRRQWLHWLTFALGLLFLLSHPGYTEMMRECARLHGVMDNLRSQLNASGYLLSRLLWISGMNIDPDLPVVHEWQQIWPALLLGTVAVIGALANFRQRPWIPFGVGWAALHLLAIYIWLPRVDIANERLLYLTDWGIFFLLAAESQRWWQRRHGWLAVTALLALLLVATLARNHDYRSEISLWTDTVAKSPGKARPLNNLGHAYRLAGRQEEARQAFLAALRLDPRSAKARNNLRSLEMAEDKEVAAP